MKTIFILVSFYLMFDLSYAGEFHTFKVIERKNRSNKTYYKIVSLEDLESSESFDGRFFKIVKGKTDAAIRFDEADKELVSKAANVYYHLSKARKYWKEKVEEPHSPEKLSKIIIRLEIKNLYDQQGQFANDNRDPQFNNALSIPAGETPDWVPEERKRKWGKEIWFRPMKKIETKDLPSTGANPLTSALETIEGPLIDYTTDRFRQRIIEHIFYPSYSANPIWRDALRFAGTIALAKAIIEASRYMDPLFAEKYFYLDTAMVPEIIYHEYAHLVLSDHLELSHSTPVIEGMADYFAASLSQKRKVYAQVRGHSNAAPKDTQNRRTYSHWYESNRLATSDFTLAVLWDVRETLGDETANKIIYEARTQLKTSSAMINNHLIQAILEACYKKCLNPRVDKLKLYETFSMKGF